MAMPDGAPKVQIPRWIQLVGLPVLLVFVWVVAGAVRHVLFLFLVASLIALLLDPLVKALHHVRLPRGISVSVVYLSFVAAIVVAIFALTTVVVDQTRTAANRVDDYFTVVHGRNDQTHADRDVDRLQRWLDGHSLSGIHIQDRGHKLAKDIRNKDVGKYTHKVVRFVEGAAISFGRLVFATVLVLVVSIYMLLDMPRLARTIDRRFPPHAGSRPLLDRMESAVAGYVRGQLLVSAIIGTSVGVGMWVLGATGALPGADGYAFLFGLAAGVTELIPYLGPWLGAVPAIVYALFVHPFAVIWVALLFLFIHQIEGHVVVPNVMGNALRLHPLLIIFGLLAGAEIYGLPGIFVALPVLAAGRAAWEFFGERVELEPWQGAGPVPVEVEIEKQPPTAPQAVVLEPVDKAKEPPEPPRAASR
jgi:predicted PurR-regulated permease PerM